MRKTLVGSNYLNFIDHFFLRILTFATLKKTLLHLQQITTFVSAPSNKKHLYCCERASLASFCLPGLGNEQNPLPGLAFQASSSHRNLTGGISVCMFLGWQSGAQDLWEFVFEFMIQLNRGWILNPNIGIVLHDSVCVVSMIVLAQYSTLCLLLATKQNFLCTFITYKSGLTWIFEKRPACLLINSILA